MGKTAKSLSLISLLSIFTAALPGIATANVSLHNGNYFIGYTDIIYPGGFEPKIERVYNSKTPFNGMFGWGWGNEYEVYLTVSADGSVVVHEYGGGAENRFSPVKFNQRELDQAVNMIADTARKLGAIGTNAQMASYKTRLRSDATFRNDEWEKFRHDGRLKARALPVGTQLTSNRFSYQYITRVKDGYIRTSDNGRVEQFNDAGKLVRISDKNNNWIALAYNSAGRLNKMTDNFNRKIYFDTDSSGHVVKLQGENGKTANYEYNGYGELVYSKDVDGNVYRYKYSSDHQHNLVQIAYSDKTTMDIAYYGADKLESVKSVKDRDGTTTAYGYETDSHDHMHSIVSVKVFGTDKKMISSSRYDYFSKVKSDGEEWTYRMITTLDGDRTETTYNECCGLPLVIKHGGEETTFQYDTKGRVTKKTTPNEITLLAYDTRVGKVSKVTRYSKVSRKMSSWSKFDYDPKGNLLFAKNSSGKGVRLFYDLHGRIMSMVDQSHRRIDFKYNENSKPIEITDPSVGSIHVSYANSGEIQKVESSAGRKIAMQVTSAFQNLLDIIRPAGVTLAF